MGTLFARHRFAAINGSKIRIESYLCWQARNTLARLRRSLLLAELSAYFWLNCLNFKSAELSLAELSGRLLHITPDSCVDYKHSYEDAIRRNSNKTARIRAKP